MNVGYFGLALGVALSMLIVAGSDISQLIKERSLAAAEAEHLVQAASRECSRGQVCASAGTVCTPKPGRSWAASVQDGAVEVAVRREWAPALFAGWGTVVHLERSKLSAPVAGQWSCPP